MTCNGCKINSNFKTEIADWDEWLFCIFTVMLNDYQPDWDIYTCQIEEQPAIIGLDLALRHLAPFPHQPDAIYIAIYMNHPREDGFPQGDEFAVLGDIEDCLVQQLEKRLQASFVGRTISNGVRDFYFYTGNSTGYDRIISEVMSLFPTYRYDYELISDRNWERYFDFLFPDVQEFQRIQNRKVLRTLQQHGDVASRFRHIDHFIFFPGEAERDAYWQEICQEGYQLEAQLMHADEPLPFGLRISRQDKTDAESIDAAVMRLWALAQTHNASYDGWETVIVAE